MLPETIEGVKKEEMREVYESLINQFILTPSHNMNDFGDELIAGSVDDTLRKKGGFTEQKASDFVDNALSTLGKVGSELYKQREQGSTDDTKKLSSEAEVGKFKNKLEDIAQNDPNLSGGVRDFIRDTVYFLVPHQKELTEKQLKKEVKKVGDKGNPDLSKDENTRIKLAATTIIENEFSKSAKMQIT